MDKRSGILRNKKTGIEYEFIAADIRELTVSGYLVGDSWLHNFSKDDYEYIEPRETFQEQFANLPLGAKFHVADKDNRSLDSSGYYSIKVNDKLFVTVHKESDTNQINRESIAHYRPEYNVVVE